METPKKSLKDLGSGPEIEKQLAFEKNSKSNININEDDFDEPLEDIGGFDSYNDFDDDDD